MWCSRSRRRRCGCWRSRRRRCGCWRGIPMPCRRRCAWASCRRSPRSIGRRTRRGSRLSSPSTASRIPPRSRARGRTRSRKPCPISSFPSCSNRCAGATAATSGASIPRRASRFSPHEYRSARDVHRPALRPRLRHRLQCALPRGRGARAHHSTRHHPPPEAVRAAGGHRVHRACGRPFGDASADAGAPVEGGGARRSPLRSGRARLRDRGQPAILGQPARLARGGGQLPVSGVSFGPRANVRAAGLSAGAVRDGGRRAPDVDAPPEPAPRARMEGDGVAPSPPRSAAGSGPLGAADVAVPRRAYETPARIVSGVTARAFALSSRDAYGGGAAFRLIFVAIRPTAIRFPRRFDA